MPKQIQSRLIINGYTINPVTNIDALNQVMNGLVSYDSNHSCDLTKGVNIHKNYLGKSLCEPFSIIVKEKDNGGMIGQAFLENGYFTIRIWDKVYPAEVQFDLYLRSELKDIDLIMDHLCNPATPYDGFGLFDCTYSLNHEYIKSSPLSKFNKEQSSYFVNDTLQNNEHGWHVTLNELDELFCYFCDKKAEFWIFLNRSCHENTDHKYNDIQVESYTVKLVNSCIDHKDMGRIRENGSPTKLEKEKDYRRSIENPNYILKNYFDENGNFLYAKNEIEKVDEETNSHKKRSSNIKWVAD